MIWKEAPDIYVNPWYDLVYHVLAHLPISPHDASNLYNPKYIAWSERFFAQHNVPGAPPRTLLEDAPLIASLYDASEQGFLLQAWPLLHDVVEECTAQMRIDFRNLRFKGATRAALASAIARHTHEALPDLFRTALWGELANGFDLFWRKHILPRAHGFRKLLNLLIADLPGLADLQWIQCLPMTYHGRLLHNDGSMTVVVGVPDDELGVSALHPLMQGCHEYFVAQQEKGGHPTLSHQAFTPTPNRPGHDAFVAIEQAALDLGARTFASGRWQEPYRAWRARFQS